MTDHEKAEYREKLGCVLFVAMDRIALGVDPFGGMVPGSVGWQMAELATKLVANGWTSDKIEAEDKRRAATP